MNWYFAENCTEAVSDICRITNYHNYLRWRNGVCTRNPIGLQSELHWLEMNRTWYTVLLLISNILSPNIPAGKQWSWHLNLLLRDDYSWTNKHYDVYTYVYSEKQWLSVINKIRGKYRFWPFYRSMKSICRAIAPHVKGYYVIGSVQYRNYWVVWTGYICLVNKHDLFWLRVKWNHRQHHTPRNCHKYQQISQLVEHHLNQFQAALSKS